MFLNTENAEEQDVKHEYGHYIQLQELGLIRYIMYVAIPSVNSGDVAYDEYYSLPFEMSADILGEVQREGYNYSDIDKGQSFINDIYKFEEQLGYVFMQIFNQYIKRKIKGIGGNPTGWKVLNNGNNKQPIELLANSGGNVVREK